MGHEISNGCGRRKKDERTLYIVITINSSVLLPVSFCLRKNPFFSNSSGSQVTAVYRVFMVSGSPRRGSTSFGGTFKSTTKLPLVNCTRRFVLCLRSTRPEGAGPKCRVSKGVSSGKEFSVDVGVSGSGSYITAWPLER